MIRVMMLLKIFFCLIKVRIALIVSNTINPTQKQYFGESTLSDQQFNIYLTIQSKYTPNSYLYQNQSNSNQLKQLIFSMQNDKIQSAQTTYIFLYFLALDPISKTVKHCFEIVTENSKYNDEYLASFINYEGYWFTLEIRNDAINKNLNFTFYQNNNKKTILYQKILLGEILLIENDFSFYIGDSKIAKAMNANQLQGPITFQLINFDTRFFPQTQSKCNYNSGFELISNTNFTATSYYEYTVVDPISKSYGVASWLRVTQNSELSNNFINVVHIQQNPNFQYLSQVGGKLLQVCYLINSTKQIVEITYQSYQFPIVPQMENNEDPLETTITIDVPISLSLYLWHFLTLSYKNNQIILNLNFIQQNQLIAKTITNVYQFSELLLVIHLGGTPLNLSNTNGIFVSPNFYNCLTTFTPNCHFSCTTCFGPYQYQCLTCSTFSNRYLSFNQTCICKTGFLEINTSSCYAIPSFLIEDKYIQLSNKKGYDQEIPEVVCSYGYFKYEDECYQCPKLNKQYFCPECIQYPNSWVFYPKCTKDYGQYNQNINNTFSQDIIFQISILNYVFDPFDIYVFSENTLQFCEYCSSLCLAPPYDDFCELSGYFHLQQLVMVTCVEQAYLLNGKCKKCPKECEICAYEKEQFVCKLQSSNQIYHPYCSNKQQSVCSQCLNDEQYFMNFDLTDCLICQIPNCKYCFQYIKNNPYYNSLFNAASTNFETEDLVIGCALCQIGFIFNFFNAQCETNTNKLGQICSNYYITDSNNAICLSSEQVSVGVELLGCQSYLTKCKRCVSPTNNQYYCLQCEFGYYLNRMYGTCLSCLNQNTLFLDCIQVGSLNNITFQYELTPQIFSLTQQYPGSQSAISLIINVKQCIQGYYLQSDTQCVASDSIFCSNYNYGCRHCESTMEGTKRLTILNLKCSNCPYYCEYCKPRLTTELNQVNPYLNFTLITQTQMPLTYRCIQKSSLHGNIFLDNQQQVSRLCTAEFPKCQLQFSMQLSSFSYLLSIIQNIIANQNLYYNLRSVNIFQLNLNMTDTYLYQSTFYDYYYILKNNLITQIISLHTTKLVISFDTINSGIIFGKLKFKDFQEIQFIQASILFSITTQSGLAFESKGKIKFKLENVIIQDSYEVYSSFQSKYDKLNTSRQYQIAIQNPSLVNFTNLLVQNISIINQNFINLTSVDKGLNFLEQLNLYNVTFFNCTFNSATIISLIEQNQYQIISIKLLRFINCNFFQSEFLSSQNLQVDGKFMIYDIEIQSCQFYDSDFISLPLYSVIVIEKLNIQNNQFQNCSLIKTSSSLSIVNVLIQNNFLVNFHLLKKIKNEVISIQENYLIKEIIIQNNKYNSMIIISILQYNAEKIQIYLLEIIQNNLTSLNTQGDKDQYFYVFQAEIVLIENINFTRFPGQKDFQIIDSSLIQITDATVLSFPNQQHCDYINLENCTLNSLFYIDSQNTYIKNLKFYNQIGVDIVFITIQESKNSNFFNSIQIEQLEIHNLQLVKTSFSQICTFIYISCNVNQQVLISSSSFQNILLNEFVQDTKVSSAALGVFISDLGQINMNNIQLNQISILNSTNSIFLIQSLGLSIKNIKALNINTYYFNYQTDIFIFDINQYINQIQVNSLGGLFNVQAQEISVLSSLYQNIIALQGGVFYITTKYNGQISFQDNIFQNITTSSQNTLEGKGGCLFVNSENSYLNLSFQENYIENITSGQLAGAFYIKPSQFQSKIFISYLKMKNVFALQNSIIFLSSVDLNFGSISHVLLKNIIIDNNLKEFQEFQERFKLKLNENQISQYNAMFYFVDYLIQIFNFTFTGFTSQPILYIKFAQKLAIHKLNFQNITYISNYLIFIENSQTINSSLIIQDFLIRNSCLLWSNTSQNLQFKLNLEEYFLSLNTSYFQKSLFELQINKNLTSAHINFLSFIENVCPFCNTGLAYLLIYSIEKSLRMSNYIFLHNICGMDSCLYVEFQKESKIFNYLSQSKFINNSANYYGAIKLQNSNIEIKYSCFLFNSALSKGGAVYYNNTQNKLVKNQIYFFKNTASIGGAIYDQNIYQKTDTDSYFVMQNQATTYGNNLATQPISLQMIINNKPAIQIEKNFENHIISEAYYTTNKTLQQFIYFPSGTSLSNYQKFDWNSFQFKKYSFSLVLKPQNLFGENMIIENSSTCISNSSIQSTDQYQASFQIQIIDYNSERNEFSLNDVIYILNPQMSTNSSIKIDISCNIIQNFDLRFYLKTLKCQIGEYFQNSQCIKCDNDQGFYSVSKNSSQCKRIEIQMIKSTTGAMIELQPGYWRPHLRSDLIEPCSKYSMRCIGGWGVADATCDLGAIGALCEQCDIYNIRGDGSYLNTKNQNCSKCGNIFIQLLLVLSQSFWIILTISLTVNSNNYSNQQLFKLKCLYRHFEAIYKNMMDQTSTLIKLANNHLQILSLIESFQISTIWNLWNIVLFFGDSNYMISYQIDCSLPQITDIAYEYAHYLLISIFPIFHFSMYCILFLTLLMAKKLSYSKSYLYSSIIYLYCFNQQNLIKCGVSLISKRTISGIEWIQANVASKYNTEIHQIWSVRFIYPMILFIGILIPLFLFYQLRRIKSKLDDRISRLKYSFLYNEYNPKSYYWEIFKMLQKISIILIANYYEQLVLIKGLLIFLIVLLYYYVCQNIQPYKLQSINAIDIKTSFILALAIVFSLLLHVIQIEQLSYLDYLIQFIIFILIITLLEAIVHRIILAYLMKLNLQLDFVRKFIVRRFPVLNQQFQCLKPYLELRFTQQQRVQQRFKKIKRYLQIQSKFIKENNMMISLSLKESNQLRMNIFSSNMSKRQINTERGSSEKMLE